MSKKEMLNRYDEIYAKTDSEGREIFDYSLKIYCLAMSTLSDITKIQNKALMEIACSEMSSLDGEIKAKTIAETALIETFKIGKRAEETIKQN